MALRSAFDRPPASARFHAALLTLSLDSYQEEEKKKKKEKNKKIIRRARSRGASSRSSRFVPRKGLLRRIDLSIPLPSSINVEFRFSLASISLFRKPGGLGMPCTCSYIRRCGGSSRSRSRGVSREAECSLGAKNRYLSLGSSIALRDRGTYWLV